MSTKTRVGIIVRYVDGNENRFVFQRPEDQNTAAARIEEMMRSNVLMIELEDRVLITPMHRIKNIEVMPKPENLPRFVIRNARVME